jgi:hypothetical protein
MRGWCVSRGRIVGVRSLNEERSLYKYSTRSFQRRNPPILWHTHKQRIQRIDAIRLWRALFSRLLMTDTLNNKVIQANAQNDAPWSLVLLSVSNSSKCHINAPRACVSRCLSRPCGGSYCCSLISVFYQPSIHALTVSPSLVRRRMDVKLVDAFGTPLQCQSVPLSLHFVIFSYFVLCSVRLSLVLLSRQHRLWTWIRIESIQISEEFLKCEKSLRSRYFSYQRAIPEYWKNVERTNWSGWQVKTFYAKGGNTVKIRTANELSSSTINFRRDTQFQCDRQQ